MRKIVTLYTFCVMSLSCTSQELNTLAPDVTWHRGNVVLGSGDELTGVVHYDSEQGVINFKEDDSTEAKSIRSFNGDQIIALSFFDSETGNPRRFHSRVYTVAQKEPNADLLVNAADREMIVGSVYLFEVVKEFNGFSVVSRQGNVTAALNGQTGTKQAKSKQSFVRQEKIYFLNRNGIFELYLAIEQSDKDGLIFDSSKSKKVSYNKALLEQYLEDHWTEVQEFIKTERLNPKSKVDLLTILNFYEELKSQ